MSGCKKKKKTEKKCRHCGVDFLAWQPLQAYCSQACRKFRWKYFSTLEYGPCPTCGKKFQSSKKKIYCSMGCYLKSPEHLARLAWHSSQPRKRMKRECKYCENEFELCDGNKYTNKFCNSWCYRKFMSERFDRWIANPEGISLPQCYDEFLIQEELPCLIKGCEWSGKNLGLHVNHAHGITAEEFKRASGFNLTTGLVTEELSKRIGYAVEGIDPPKTKKIRKKKSNYKSLESIEHRNKMIEILREERKKTNGICKYCNVKFTYMKFSENKREFCSKSCSSKYFYRKHKENLNKG